MPTTILRPRASAANDKALAAASTSPSFWISGGEKERGEQQAGDTGALGVWRRPGAQPGRNPGQARGRTCLVGHVSPTPSRFVWSRPAQQAGWREDEDQDEDRKDDHVGPSNCDELPAQGLDQPDEDAAQHRAGDAANAAWDRRGKGPQARAIANEKARVVVVESEDQRRGAGQPLNRGRKRS